MTGFSLYICTAILSITNENRQPLAVARPKCNSILHLFGEWLFDAAHIGSEMWLHSLKSKLYRRSLNIILITF